MNATTKASRNGQPQRAADPARDRAGERVDAGAEDVADHEEQQQLRPDRPLELRAAPSVRYLPRCPPCGNGPPGRSCVTPLAAFRYTPVTRYLGAVAPELREPRHNRQRGDDHGDTARRRGRARAEGRGGRAVPQVGHPRPARDDHDEHALHPPAHLVGGDGLQHRRPVHRADQVARPGDGEAQHREPQRAASARTGPPRHPRRRSPPSPRRLGGGPGAASRRTARRRPCRSGSRRTAGPARCRRRAGRRTSARPSPGTPPAACRTPIATMSTRNDTSSTLCSASVAEPGDDLAQPGPLPALLGRRAAPAGSRQVAHSVASSAIASSR